MTRIPLLPNGSPRPRIASLCIPVALLVLLVNSVALINTAAGGSEDSPADVAYIEFVGVGEALPDMPLFLKPTTMHGPSFPQYCSPCWKKTPAPQSLVNRKTSLPEDTRPAFPFFVLYDGRRHPSYSCLAHDHGRVPSFAGR